MVKKLSLTRETLRHLDDAMLRGIGGGQNIETQTCDCDTFQCQDSIVVTECFPCQPTVTKTGPTCRPS